MIATPQKQKAPPSRQDEQSKKGGGNINTYLVESAISDTSAEALDALRRAALNSSVDAAASGKPVRCLYAITMPGDGLVLWIFEAVDAIDIRDLYEAAELPLTRIVEVIRF